MPDLSQNPANLAFRFLLEIGALVALGYWGWTLVDGPVRYLLAAAAPLLMAVLWGTFRVPGDASHSGKAPVAVPGWLRLLLELALFGGAAWALVAAGQPLLGLVFGALVLLHYLLSWGRIRWLLRQ